jgi:hypothetical protein
MIFGMHKRVIFRMRPAAPAGGGTYFLVDRLIATHGWKMMTPLLMYVSVLLK